MDSSAAPLRRPYKLFVLFAGSHCDVRLGFRTASSKTSGASGRRNHRAAPRLFLAMAAAVHGGEILFVRGRSDPEYDRPVSFGRSDPEYVRPVSPISSNAAGHFLSEQPWTSLASSQMRASTFCKRGHSRITIKVQLKTNIRRSWTFPPAAAVGIPPHALPPQTIPARHAPAPQRDCRRKRRRKRCVLKRRRSYRPAPFTPSFAPPRLTSFISRRRRRSDANEAPYNIGAGRVHPEAS